MLPLSASENQVEYMYVWETLMPLIAKKNQKRYLYKTGHNVNDLDIIWKTLETIKSMHNKYEVFISFHKKSNGQD